MPIFKITITKEVIDKSLMCGTAVENSNIEYVMGNCGIARAISELIPNIYVTEGWIRYFDLESNKIIEEPNIDSEQAKFIRKFDSYSKTPNNRYSLVGKSFNINIPQEVIDYYYQDKMNEVYEILNKSDVLQLQD